MTDLKSSTSFFVLTEVETSCRPNILRMSRRQFESTRS